MNKNINKISLIISIVVSILKEFSTVNILQYMKSKRQQIHNKEIHQALSVILVLNRLNGIKPNKTGINP